VTGEGRSVERQLEACRQLCELRGWTVVDERVDNSISASTGKVRPAWQSVLAMVGAREVDLIVAWHIDRMTRSMLDLEELILLAEDAGIGVATASGDLDLTTDVGRMVARILAAVARAEVERKGARQKLANAARAAEGDVHFGGVRPFGYENDRVTVAPEEAEAIRQAAVDVLAGKALAEVAREWAAAGLVSSRAEVGWEKGNRKPKAGWTPRGVKNVLVNPRYAGIRVYNGDEVGTGVWDKILDLETYLSLVQMLVDPNPQEGRECGSQRAQASVPYHRHRALPDVQGNRTCGFQSRRADVLVSCVARPHEPRVRRHSYPRRHDRPALSAGCAGSVDPLGRRQRGRGEGRGREAAGQARSARQAAGRRPDDR